MNWGAKYLAPRFIAAFTLDLRIKVAKKIKLGKIAIIIFLTALIWVWADLAQEREFSIPTVTIRVAGSINPTLLATFKDEQGASGSSVSVYNVELRGPASKIAEVERMRNKGTLEREFFVDPEGERMTQPGEHRLNVLSFLKQNKQIKDLGLTVEACEPQNLTIDVRQLVKMNLAVRCFDENGLLRQEASIDPPEVEAFVPGEQTATAKVRLTPSELERARGSPIQKTPYVELPGGQQRDVSTKVKVTMPSAEDVLSEQTIGSPKLGIELSLNLQGKYRVEVKNLSEVLRPFTLRATREAKQAYEQEPFQMTLHILDGDEQVQTEQKRDVVYTLPWRFVQSGEIVPPQPPAQVSFRLTPISAEPP
jgi:hypothetical protein